MLKKRLGLEVIERDWIGMGIVDLCFKTPSTIIIPEGCKRVGSWAFEGCDWLEKVIIPESVEYIGYYAFWGCTNTDIILEKPVSEFKGIASNAFKYCGNVEEKVRD